MDQIILNRISYNTVDDFLVEDSHDTQCNRKTERTPHNPGYMETGVRVHHK